MKCNRRRCGQRRQYTTVLYRPRQLSLKHPRTAGRNEELGRKQGAKASAVVEGRCGVMSLPSIVTLANPAFACSIRRLSLHLRKSTRRLQDGCVGAPLADLVSVSDVSLRPLAQVSPGTPGTNALRPAPSALSTVRSASSSSAASRRAPSSERSAFTPCASAAAGTSTVRSASTRATTPGARRTSRRRRASSPPCVLVVPCGGAHRRELV
jgi:hypothetical protein